MNTLMTYCICSLVLSNFLNAQPATSSEKYSGAVVISGISPEEARSRSIRKARLTAIEKKCGVQIQSASMVKDFMLSGDFVSSASYGQVISEKIIKEEVQINQFQVNRPPVLTYSIEMEITVTCESGRPDPAFRLNLQTNKMTFVSGEELILKLQSTSDCYLTVLNYSADEKVSILMPSSVFPDNFIAAQQEIEIPSRRERELGIHFRMQPVAGQEKSTEIIQVIATKQKVDFFENLETHDGFGVWDNMTIAADKLMRWITSIPVQQRTQETVMIEVHHQ